MKQQLSCIYQKYEEITDEQKMGIYTSFICTDQI